jgi:hypothetical protein
MRFHLRHLVLAAVAFCVLALAGCANEGLPADDAPEFAEALAQSVNTAARQQDPDASIRFDLTMQLKVDLGTAADSEAFKDPITINATGASTNRAADMDMTVQAGGRTFRYKTVAFSADGSTPDRQYVLYDGEWYDASMPAEEQPLAGIDATPSKKELRRITAVIRRLTDDIVSAEAFNGPNIDGDTWMYKLNLNADGIRDLSMFGDRPITEQSQQMLDVLADEIDMKVMIGKDDHLPRRFELEADIKPEDFPGGDRLAGQLKGVDLDIKLDLTGWNEPVQITEPSGPMKSSEELGQRIIMDALGEDAATQLGPFLTPSTSALNSVTTQ